MTLFKKVNSFRIFEQFVENYKDKTILDFGGNRGNLLSYSEGKILPKNYTCLDVSKDGLNVLSEEFPESKRIYWNRYHPTYNPKGKYDEPFPLRKPIWRCFYNYDICFANSVFTHMSINEILYCLRELQHHCDSIYFTYIDNNNETILDILQNKHKAIDLNAGQLNALKKSHLTYILDGNKIYPYTIPNAIYNTIWTIINTKLLAQYIRNNSPYELDITSGLTDGFNWMKINVGRHATQLGAFGY